MSALNNAPASGAQAHRCSTGPTTITTRHCPRTSRAYKLHPHIHTHHRHHRQKQLSPFPAHLCGAHKLFLLRLHARNHFTK